MKKTLLYAAVLMTLAVGCNPDNGVDDTTLDDKEAALQSAMAPYVNNTVIATYKGMADNAIALSEACAVILEKYDAKTLTTADVQVACDAWNKSREYWEWSEAFLYGPAANHNIDPHIDSWPLDQNAMIAMLNNEQQMAAIERDGGAYVGNNLGYGLLGFHAVEYNLYELVDDGNKSQAHSVETYTRPQLVYLAAVAEDLMVQCVCLEACWAGLDNVTAQKQAILAEAELDGYAEMGRGYGAYMTEAGKAGSVYANFQDAAEEIIQGCIDIIDEVGNTKIGNPHRGSTEEERNYIESPYSLNSVADFVGNVQSVKNAYTGSVAGDASISDYIQQQNPELDAQVREAIEVAMATIRTIPEPFAKTATGNEAALSIEKLATLQELLENQVLAELSK